MTLTSDGAAWGAHSYRVLGTRGMQRSSLP